MVQKQVEECDSQSLGERCVATSFPENKDDVYIVLHGVER